MQIQGRQCGSYHPRKLEALRFDVSDLRPQLSNLLTAVRVVVLLLFEVRDSLRLHSVPLRDLRPDLLHLCLETQDLASLD